MFSKKKNFILQIYTFSILALTLLSCNIFNNNNKKPLLNVSINKFYADTTIIEKGKQTTLHWDVALASKIEIKGIAKNLPEKGELQITPSVSRNYTITATQTIDKYSKTVSKTIKIIVQSPKFYKVIVPAITRFGDKTEIYWRALNTDYVKIKGYNEAFPPEFKTSMFFTKPQKLTLYAIRGNNIDSTSVEIKIQDTKYFGTKGEAYIGDVTLKWAVYNAKSVSIKGIKKQFNAIGEYNLEPMQDTSFTLTAILNNGQKVIITQQIKLKQPTIEYFTGESMIEEGEVLKLKWNVRAPEKARVELVGISNNIEKNGVYKICPTSSSTYQLKLIYNGKIENKFHKVIVNSKRSFAQNTIDFSLLKSGKKLDLSIIGVDKSEYPKKFNLQLMLVDEDGNFLKNLDSTAIRRLIKKIYQTDAYGKDMEVSYEIKKITEVQSLPFDISLVLDYSGSMSNIIDSLEKAVKIFLANKNDSDRISIVKFDDKLQLAQALSSSAFEILENTKFEGLKGFGGATALYAAADEGISSLKESNKNKRVILFTDGGENSSYTFEKTHAITANQLALNARKSEAKIIPIAFGSGANHELLYNLAQTTDGMYYALNNTKDIFKVFQEIPILLREYYIISINAIVYEGNHEFKIEYYTNKDSTKTAKTTTYIGDKFNLDKYEFAPPINYWSDTVFFNKKPLKTPQVIALFDYDKSVILEKYKPGMDSYISFLKSKPNTTIAIFGHTDTKGSREYNIKLSTSRANAIKEYFVLNGIKEDRIKLIGCGMSFPLWVIEDQEWKAHENRRIEVVLYE